MEEFWRLQRDRVSERELSDAQAYLTGNFPLTIETPSAIALQVLNAVFYGLDLNELQTFRERVNAVTPDDIQRVARLYLHPDKLSIVLVGDASVFAKQLPGAGFQQYERVPLADLDLATADFRRHAGPAGRLEDQLDPALRAELRPVTYQTSGAPPAQASKAASAQDLIALAVRAKGGAEKLRSIKTLKAAATMTVSVRRRRSCGCRDGDVDPIPGIVSHRRQHACGTARAGLPEWRILGQRRAWNERRASERGRRDAQQTCSGTPSGCCWGSSITR